MAEIVPLRAALAERSADPLLTLPAWARDEAERRQALINAAKEGRATGVSPATLRRWQAALNRGGLAALAPRYQGRQRKPQAWDARAIELINSPNRLDCGAIAAIIRREMGVDVTPAQVRRLRKTLPSNLDETSPRKLGRHHYRLNETPYVIRDWGHVPVGYLYEMDGHTCDFYVEHPATGGYFRPELTFLLDVRSQYIVDFWLGGYENSTDLRWLLSRAFLAHDHVCHELHVDPGAAKARTMADPVVGFAAKLGVEIHFAIPGNARGKGLVEGEYAVFERWVGKAMATYLHDRTDDAMRLFAAKWRRGLVPRMTVRQLYDEIARYVEQRRREPRECLGGKSPAELWAGLQRNPVIAPAAAMCRPRAERTVQNGRITIHRRRYQLAQPYRAQHEDRQVIVEYDDWRDETVWIYDLQGRYLCEAALLHRQPGIPVSRVQERLARTAEGQRKRLELRMAELEARARPATPAALLDELDQTVPQIEQPAAERVLGDGTSFAAVPAPSPRMPRTVDASVIARLEREIEQDAQQVETETAEQRYARARALQAAPRISEADARWLAIYTTSAEYRAQRLIHEEE